MTTISGTNKVLNIVVIVAALGYFVDIYDLILFGVVRVQSLADIGIPPDQIKDAGVHLINMQMMGMIMGGIVWGILGDKRGRLSVLFLTILLYSLANIANGFVQTYQQYEWLRAIAGFGLAGELGIGITLVSEVMTKETRGWGTSIVSGVGIAGATLAYLVAEWGWKEAYWAGGVLGLLLLALRVYVHESGMFGKVKESKVSRGNFLSIFLTKEKFLKYIYCILLGVPVWFVIGILVMFSKEFGDYLKISETIIPGKSIMYHYIGASLGSLITGFLSQWLKSRKKSILIALVALTISITGYFAAFGASAGLFYLIIFILGLAQGYWAIFVTVASEQFGTNIRSTVTTTAPNFVRGSLVLMTLGWNSLALSMGIWNSAMIVGGIVMLLAFVSLFNLKETYGKDLDYIEVE